MSRNLLIGVVALIVIGGGGAAYLASRGDDEQPPSTSQTQQTSQQNNSSPSNQFEAVSTEGKSYRATITSTRDGQEVVAVLESDGKGNSQYKATESGQEIRMIFTGDAFISCNGDQCFKTAGGQAGFDPDAYSYSDQEIDNYKGSSTYQGQEACPAGTCDKWQVSYEGTTSTILIDPATKLLSQISTNVDGIESKIAYEFVPITIDIPANVQEIPGLSG
jgi:hypothetical protein